MASELRRPYLPRLEGLRERAACPICCEIHGLAAGDAFHALLPSGPYVRRVAAESAQWALVPSLGALTGGHVLLCPKAHVRQSLVVALDDVAEWSAVEAAVVRVLESAFSEGVLSFEHGMSPAAQGGGCGVDHAHVHFLPIPKSLRVRLPDADWREVGDTPHSIREAVEGNEYLTVRFPDGRRLVASGSPGRFESQILRKAVAKALGVPQRWNWRIWPDALRADEIHRGLVPLFSGAHAALRPH
jgi:ATP adenylyltransferase